MTGPGGVLPAPFPCPLCAWCCGDVTRGGSPGVPEVTLECSPNYTWNHFTAPEAFGVVSVRSGGGCF